MMLLLVLAAVAGAAPCRTVEGDHILLRDLAAADARFNAGDGSLPLALSPVPPAKRVFTGGELARIAAKQGVASQEPFESMCFARAAAVPTSDAVVKAIRADWTLGDAAIELLEQSKNETPAGELHFPKPAAPPLGRPGEPILIRGFVVSGSLRFPLWARVRVHGATRRVVAVSEIAAGREVSEDLVREDAIDGLPTGGGAASSLDQVLHHVTRVRIAAGMPVALNALNPPRLIARGSVVKVEVHDGATKLVLDARAENDGFAGSMIELRNPASGRPFQARVTGENTALVVPKGSKQP